MDESFLYRTPTAVIAGALLAVMLTLDALFYRVGRAQTTRAPGSVTDLGPVDAAVAALLGLILAFSFSLAAQRFEARQALIVKEANAIGTAYLRCALTDPPDRAALEDALVRYVDLRVAFYEQSRDRARFTEILAESDRVQTLAWSRAAALVRARPDYPALGLLLDALNAVIDVHAERVAATRLHVPDALTWLLLGLALAWSMFMGFALGLKGRARSGVWIASSVLVTLVTAATIDLDRPHRGFITLDAGHRSMLELRDSLRAHRAAP